MASHFPVHNVHIVNYECTIWQIVLKITRKLQ